MCCTSLLALSNKQLKLSMPWGMGFRALFQSFIYPSKRTTTNANYNSCNLLGNLQHQGKPGTARCFLHNSEEGGDPGQKRGCSAVLSNCPKRSGQGVLLLVIALVTKNATLCRPECKQPDLICAINTTTGRAVGTAEVHSTNQHGHHLPHRGTASCSAADTGFCGSCYSVQVFFFFPLIYLLFNFYFLVGRLW